MKQIMKALIDNRDQKTVATDGINSGNTDILQYNWNYNYKSLATQISHDVTLRRQ